MFKKRLLYFIPLFFLTACDCYTVVEGRIVSTETKLPISNATIELLDKKTTVKSDDKGQFRITYMSGFCFDPKIRVTSENCKPFEVKINSSNHSKSYEIKSETKFIDYEKPFYPNPDRTGTSMTGTWINSFSQNFAVKDDSLFIYLDENNIKKEIENIQKTLKESYQLNGSSG